MPPKKPPGKDKIKKKPDDKCHHNNRGYCKAKQDCDKKHSDNICKDPECIEDNCAKRHPYECTYGIRCKFNKTKECMYMHDTPASDDFQIGALKEQFNNKLDK